MPVEAHLAGITHAIQLAIAPVFLLTGIGTIINVLNTRLGRIVDRRRKLEERFDTLTPDVGEAWRIELRQLTKRARLIYWAILLAVSSALFVCVLVAGVFIDTFAPIDMALAIAVFFVLAMLALIGSLILLLREIYLAVRHAPR